MTVPEQDFQTGILLGLYLGWGIVGVAWGTVCGEAFAAAVGVILLALRFRRQLPLAAITDELAGLRVRRRAALQALASEGDPDLDGPLGTQPMSRSLPFRVLDLWMHEQDIRRAVGLPVRDDCPAAHLSLDMVLKGWSRGLPADVGRPATLTIEVTGATPSTTVVEIDGGGSEVTLTGDLALLTWLFAGRGAAPEGAITGDADTAAAIAAQLARTP